MAHRLLGSEGGCRNMHGHSYRMMIEVWGDMDENDMIIDFNDVSEIVRPLVNELDHSFLCDENDLEVITFLQAQEMKHTVVPFKTTVENLCKHFAENLQPMLSKHANLHGFLVRIYETARNSACLEVDLRK